MDEPDIGWHPEWSRQFIYILKEITDKITSMIYQKLNKKIMLQFIISTHSPFIISDLPHHYVHKISQGKIVMKEDKTFMANIHELLVDNFFLESSYGYEASKMLRKSKIAVLEDHKDDDAKRFNDGLVELIGDDVLKFIL